MLVDVVADRWQMIISNLLDKVYLNGITTCLFI